MAKVIGPGGTSKSGGCPTGKSMGPGGAGGMGKDMTTSRGYETKRTTGLRTEYRETARGVNSKASK